MPDLLFPPRVLPPFPGGFFCLLVPFFHLLYNDPIFESIVVREKRVIRLLHTSDLHLGHRLLERSRIEEQKLFLDWLVERIRDEDIDLLIAAGDIFDTGTPPNAAIELYYDFLHRVSSNLSLGTVIVGGNHDSPAMLNAPGTLLKAFDVHVVGGASSPEEELLVLKDPAGTPSVCIGAVPFLRERDVRTPRPGESIEDRDRSTVEGIRDHYRKVAAAGVPPGIPFIVTGHLFAGGEKSGGERDLYIGSLGQVGFSVFPGNADYYALGHLHRPQTVGGNEHVRYCGSPLALDFGDDSAKSVLLVELGDTGLEEIRKIEVPAFRRLVALQGNLPEILWKLNDLSAVPGELTPWADILVEDSLPDAQERVEEAAANLNLEILRVRYSSSAAGEDPWAEGEQLEELSPLEVFRRCCEAQGIEADDLLEGAYGELLLQAERNIAENTAGEDV